MSEQLYEKGVVSTDYLKKMGYYPSEERFSKGPVVICECVECIPCNPCETACRFGAITVGENISSIPHIESDKCTGCGLCISACSGLALFIIDKSYSRDVASVSFPFEYLPLPDVGDTVDATDRSGESICKGIVKKIVFTKRSDRTTVVTLEVPKKFVDEVRGMTRL